MPLGLSPYVTSLRQDAWPGQRVENDRPSPLRINKQREPNSQSRQIFRTPLSEETSHELNKQGCGRLKVAKRRSLWALTTPSSEIVENHEQLTFPPRPYSVDPSKSLYTSVFHELDSLGKTKSPHSKAPQTTEEAEEMLREASRTFSGASDNSKSWNSFVSGGCSVRKSSDTHSRSSVVRHASSSTDGPRRILSMDSILPHVLSPHISIYTDSYSRYFGQHHVWAAIEVSGILSHAYSADGTGSKPAQPKEEEHHLDLFFKHGCLHDLKVEILPLDGTTVLQVFHEQTFPTILYAGSKVLILTQVQIDPKTVYSRVGNGHRRQRSEELMADLESHLGDSQMPYMKVRITYSHSAFSDYFGHEILVGVSQRCTKLETTAIGALKQHNRRSAWSPQPIYSTESINCVMQKHWSDGMSAEWLQKIKNSRVGVNEVQRKESATASAQETRAQTPVERPDNGPEGMRQFKAAYRLSEPRHYSMPNGLPKVNHESKQHPLHSGSLRTRRSRSRNTSGTTCTSGSLSKKKSFAAGIWRTLTPSMASKGEGETGMPGAWNWNAWF